MSADIKLSKTQISKIIQSSVSFDSCLGNLEKKALTNIAIPLARDYLPGLVCNLASNAINMKVINLISSIVKGISGRGVRRAGRGCMDKNF